jgi:endoglucanase
LTSATALPVSVQYATQNGNALSGQDYVATTGTLIFQPGEASKTIAVTLIEDNQEEGNETFTITLSGSNPAAPLVTLNPAMGTGTITNDDVRIPVPALGWLATFVLSGLLMVIGLFSVRRLV